MKFFGNSTKESEQQRLARTVETIGDILFTDTSRRTRTKQVIAGLGQLESYTIRLLDIKRTDPGRFESLVVDQQYEEMYKRDKNEAQLRFSLEPRRYLTTFSTVLNQLIRVHSSAIKAKNQEVSRSAAYSLTHVLEELIKQEGNETFVQIVLQEIDEAARMAIENKDVSMYETAQHWYIRLVFEKSALESYGIRLEYMRILDEAFFRSIKRTIRENNLDLWKDLVSFLFHTVMEGEHDSELWSYGNRLINLNFERYETLSKTEKLDGRIEYLVAKQGMLSTVEEVNSWLREFEKVREIIQKEFYSKNPDKEEREAVEVLRSTRGRFFSNNVRRILMAALAYAIREGKGIFVRYAWEFKQPPDAEAIWGGNKITPENLDDLLKLYFVIASKEQRINFGEDHRGSSLWYSHYFLWTLCWLTRHELSSISESKPSKNYSLSEYSPRQLNEIGDVTKSLLTDVSPLTDNKELAKDLGFDVSKMAVIHDTVVRALEDMKESADKRIVDLRKQTGLTRSKLESFADEIEMGYSQSVKITQLLEDYRLMDEGHVGSIRPVHVRKVCDKEIFFAEWFVSYFDFGKIFGENFAATENGTLYSLILSKCKISTLDELKEAIETIDDPASFFVLLNHRSILADLQQIGDFRPTWKEKLESASILGLEGWIKHSRGPVRVFNLQTNRGGRSLILIDIRKFGRIIGSDYSESLGESDFRRRRLMVKIRAFSEHVDIIEDIMKEKPGWLLKLGDQEEQKDYLLTKALVEISTNVDFEPSPEFIGRLLVM